MVTILEVVVFSSRPCREWGNFLERWTSWSSCPHGSLPRGSSAGRLPKRRPPRRLREVGGSYSESERSCSPRSTGAVLSSRTPRFNRFRMRSVVSGCDSGANENVWWWFDILNGKWDIERQWIFCLWSVVCESRLPLGDSYLHFPPWIKILCHNNLQFLQKKILLKT